jgi:hypothetical protein
MSILDSVKKVVKKLSDKEYREQETDNDIQLKKWKDKLEAAKTNWDTTTMDEREMLYNGTHDVDANINNTSTSTTSTANRLKANNVHNIVYEFIEAQIDTSIPQPTVRSKRRGFDELANMIENSAKNDLDEMNIERINDENERITPVQGYSIFEVSWEPDFKHHLYRGEIKVDNRHPKTLIPQPGIYNIQKMDYFFLLSPMTKTQVKQRFKKVISSSDGEQYPEINYFYSDQSTINTENERVTVITVYFKDEEDGEYGRFVWCNETVLENLPKFYYRRLEHCVKCGAIKGTEDECQEMVEMVGMSDSDGGIVQVPCGSKKFKTTLEEKEIIDEVKALETGLPVGAEIPYYCPTRYPVIIRRNVPVNFQLGGQSDVDIIRDQADAIKKVVSRLEEKIIRGGGIIKAADDHRFDLTNELYQVIRGNPSQLNALGTMSFTDDIQKELAVASYMYKAAQDTLGITNSFQGKQDSTAVSGVAKQIQVQQASGRMQSKLSNKYNAFKELFEIMFEFKLAYYDELRPYMTKGAMGQIDYGDFDKYKFIQMDADGQYYYNTDFLFSSSAGDGFPKDKMWISQQASEDFKNKAIDKIGLWTIRESVNFPNAAEMKKAAIEEKQLMMQQQAMQNQQNQPDIDSVLEQLSPEEQQAFMSQPPEVQEQIIAEMQGGTPNAM